MGRKKKQYLYHATYGPLVSSIRQNGLGNTTRTMWEDSVPGVVYCCEDPEEAIDFVSCCDKGWNEFEKGGKLEIALFRIDPKGLDPEKLFTDRNILDAPQGCFEYHGVIDSQFLRLIQIKAE